GSTAAPYLNSLRRSGTLLTQYFATAHNSAADYISLTSGQSPSALTASDCINWFVCMAALSNPLVSGGASIADQIEHARFSWKAYMEDMPAPCTHAQPTDLTDPFQGDSTKGPGHNYADRHNPFIYYAPITGNSARCAAHVVPFTQFAPDLTSRRLPNYSFIVPNTCEDGHDTPRCADGSPGGLPTADRWLHQHVPALLSYLMRNQGMLAITFDEASGDSSGCCGGGVGGAPGFGGRVGLLALSPSIAAGRQIATPYDHVSLLRTVEDAFGITAHLNNASAPSEHAMTNLFASH
ncbi:MAG: phosphoesterase, partial [Chloroflexi bacterium]|nr:phosphoesterase [Chloroflexota bacterium]